eukprot:COSAG02_NODE_29296_length_572_cov_0.809725_1_plen_94_part_10
MWRHNLAWIIFVVAGTLRRGHRCRAVLAAVEGGGTEAWVPRRPHKTYPRVCLMWTEMYNRTVGSVRYGASIVVVSVVRPHPISSTIKHLARLDK